MGKVDDAVTSLRNQPQAKTLRALLERNMGITVDTHEAESIGTITPADSAALSVVRAIFDGGAHDEK